MIIIMIIIKAIRGDFPGNPQEINNLLINISTPSTRKGSHAESKVSHG